MRIMRLLVLPALTLVLVSIAQAQNVSFNATISGSVVPGVYGQVVIGNGPPPPVVYAQPVIVQPAPVVVGAPAVEPVYLHVPPGHARDWRKHCHEYHACNRPVYFVRSAEYEPGYRPEHHGHGHGHDEDRDDHDHGHRD
ncbi:MAG TPA: hypothetical protein VMT66_05790 [Steroidobacteraceae bacterium]|nr:hypothetical protein [Steroidobacteraceae bacterium]